MLRNFVIPIPRQILFGLLNQEEWDWRNSWHFWGRGDVHTLCWWGNLKEGEHLENLGTDGKVILQWIFQKWVRVYGLN